MTRLTGRLLLLLALLTAPFGMLAAPAATAHLRTASMPVPHCPDQQAPEGSDGVADCAMACAAALPVVEVQPAASGTVPGVSQPSIADTWLTSRYCEIATPPPKLA